jgi:hypothetical protein
VTADRRVGPYRLVELLGRGGMGEVWRADDVTGAAGGAPRQVALKLLDPARARDPDARARFGREVAAARRVRGASVATLLDADVDADQPWLASAYVAGPSLDEHVGRHGPLADAPLRALGAALADALVSIHGAGVVHRDLTPRNVVLGPDGPRVVDFGIAWYPGSAAVTRTGSWVGTPAWMAPERLASDRVTAASDVWSWGAVVAFAARGRPPVAGDTPEVTAHRLAAGVVDLDGVPAWLRPSVEAAMALDPTRRPDAAALLAALSGLPGAPAPPAATVPDGGGPTVVQPPLPPTRLYTAASPDAAGRRRRAAPGSGTGGSGSGSPSAGGSPGGDVRGGTNGRRLARWGSAAVLVAGAVAVGMVGGLLVAVIALAVLVMVAVVLRVARERLPEGARPVPPTWAVALAGPVVLGTALVDALGPVWGAAALVALIAVFFLLGGDIG